MKVFLILIIIILTFSIDYCYAEINFFSENLAHISDRYGSEIGIPFFNLGFNFYNSLLSLNDLQMFEKDYVLTNSDKRKLTNGDLNVSMNMNFNLVSFGYRNYHFRSDFIAFAKANVLKKDYSKIIFYGNELDKEYYSKSGKGSGLYTFFKTSIFYGIPKTFYLTDYFELKTYDNIIGRVIDYFYNAELKASANVNFYFPNFVAQVLESNQRFHTKPEENFYEYELKYAFIEDQSTYKGRLSPGLGFAIQGSQKNSSFYFSLDDIFARIKYEDLTVHLYQGSFTDSLLYFDNDYEPWDESVEIDSLFISRKNISLKPAVTIGGIFSYTDRLGFSMKYKYREYETDNGLSIGSSYKLFDSLSLGMIMGKDELWYYNFIWQINYRNFMFKVSNIFYDGLFGFAKGYGLDLKMKLGF